MCAFRVDTTEMVSAVGNIQSGSEFLKGDAKGRLDSIYDRLGSAGLSENGDAHEKVEGFRNRWNDEFGIIGDMLAKFKDTLTSASQAYDTADLEIANATRPAAAPPTEV